MKFVHQLALALPNATAFARSLDPNRPLWADTLCSIKHFFWRLPCCPVKTRPCRGVHAACVLDIERLRPKVNTPRTREVIDRQWIHPWIYAKNSDMLLVSTPYNIGQDLAPRLARHVVIAGTFCGETGCAQRCRSARTNGGGGQTVIVFRKAAPCPKR